LIICCWMRNCGFGIVLTVLAMSQVLFSILDVAIEIALQQACFDHENIHKRCGIYNWTKERGRK
jgi:hypothetical protein